MSNGINNEQEANIDETKETPISTDASENTEEQGVTSKRIPYDRFKQKVDEDNALKEKLDQFEKEQAENKRKELEEQEKYKELYEQPQTEIASVHAQRIEDKKQATLKGVGYDDEQVALLSKLIDGSTDEEIAESVELITAKFPIKDSYADPSPFNGTKEKPATTTAEDHARSIVERIKHKL